jgi:hypothetical protein
MSALRYLAAHRRLTTFTALTALGLCPGFVSACGGTGSVSGSVSGQSDFTSAPQLGQTPGNASAPGAEFNSGSGGADAATTTATSGGSSGSSTRTVQETDLYAVENNRLYYLNSYRGLMVFDITNPDAPQFLGHSAIFGDPQVMTVENGVCTVVVGDWYGMDSGSPFHGSIVRGLNAQDPTNITVVGEAHLGGYVQDTRVVGDVLYAVIQDYGWQYGWYDGWGAGYYGGYGYGSNSTPDVAIASVSFANGVVNQVGYQKFTGSGGVFNVTPSSIMLATNVSGQPSGLNDPGTTNLQYVDISDPGGAIKLRGSIDVSGAVTGWGPDNGRWNLDFADGVTAHALGCADQYCGGNGYLLSTVDFTNPDAPVLASSFTIPDLGWSVAARFNGTQLYLSPSDGYYGSGTTTPFSIYDLSNPAAPKLAGSTQLAGSPWLYLPDGTNLFSIGSSNATNSSQVQVEYLSVQNPSAPAVLGTSNFGSGWAWSPAASTFKAVTVNDTLGFVVVPFSGWDYDATQYTNGVQLVGFTPSGLTTSATAFSKGWVQRGIFVGGRLYSISDEALAVVDYTNPAAPTVTGQLTLARNVINAQPQGASIAELSSDWWGNDVSTSEMRVLPIDAADHTTDDGLGVSASIAGVGAQVFQNGNLSYVVTQVQHPAPCNGGWSWQAPSGSGCVAWAEQVQIVDTSNGGATLRGTLMLPDTPQGWGGWGWGGFWYYDWYDGANVVQVGADALAFRRWYPEDAPQNPDGSYPWVDALDALYVVDLSNPDAPSLASLTVTADPTTWWGDMQAVGDTLYTSHYEWVNHPDPKDPSGTDYHVKYYLDIVDLSDRAHPSIGQKVNVPGQLVGASSADPTLLYTIDYRWDESGNAHNDLDVVKLDGGHAYLQSVTQLDGWVGQVIVQNDVAYASVQEYDWMLQGPNGTYTQPYVELHQIDLSNPQSPADYIATKPTDGWGWLLGVQGDRAIITSGWGPMGYDIYKLTPNAAPVYDQSVRALGWGPNSILRQGNTLYMASGYWGVQSVNLQ